MDYPMEAPHRLELDARRTLHISGVENVERFDGSGIVLVTTEGLLVIEGEELHIGSLRLDGGELLVEGRIDALSYETAPVERGLFRRLFG